MASAPASTEDLIDLVRKSGLAEERLDGWLKSNPSLPPQVHALAALLVQEGLITSFHAKHMLTGKYKGFVLGQYKVLDQIGAGGMGVIFLAEHLTMKRQVAIKVLPADKANDEESRERFYREARIVAALDHPNVVHAFDIDKSGDTHFMVMEYIEGESLEHMVRRKGPLPLRDAADYIAQSARGLQHAHERGLVHRDIKPANLLLDKTGVIKVLDMGLARFFEENSNLTTELCSGSVIGTADYMAPEQAVNSHDVDIRADIYSLGITLYTLLTGQPPYGSLTVAQKLLAHHMRVPEPVQNVRPEMPDELADIVMTMLAKKPEDRYQIPAEVDQALSDWLKKDAVSSAPTAKNERTIIYRHGRKKKDKPKRRWLLPTVIGSFAVLVAIIALIVTLTDDKPTKSNNADRGSTGAAAPNTSNSAAVEKKLAGKKDKVGEVRRFDTKGEIVERLAISSNETLLAGGGRGGGVRIWEIESGRLIKEFKAHNGVVASMTFSPSGKLLATSGQDGQIKIWSTDTWNEQMKMAGPKGATWSVAFSPDGNRLFSGGDDGRGQVWNVQTGSHLHACDESHGKPINHVAWSPDGKYVYTTGLDNSIRGWDAETGKMKFRINRDKKCQFVTVSPDSGSLLCATDGPQLFVLDALTGQSKASLPVLAVQWNGMFSKEGGLFVTSGNESMIHVWDTETRTPYRNLVGHFDSVLACAISADGHYVFSGSKDKTVRMWALPVR